MLRKQEPRTIQVARQVTLRSVPSTYLLIWPVILFAEILCKEVESRSNLLERLSAIASHLRTDMACNMEHIEHVR